MNSTDIVIRIKAEDRAVDWKVEHPNQLTFKDTLVGMFSSNSWLSTLFYIQQIMSKMTNSAVRDYPVPRSGRCTKYRRRVCAAISGQSDKHPSRTP